LPWLNATEGTFLVEYQKSFSGNYLNFTHPLSVYAAGNNAMTFYNQQNSSQVTNFSMTTNGVNQVDYVQAPTVQGLNKLVQTYKQNEVIFAANGTVAGIDYSVAVPTLTTMRIGAANTGGQSLSDCVSRIIYYPTAISSSQAAVITNPALF
jgi:hypothetical protein